MSEQEATLDDFHKQRDSVEGEIAPPTELAGIPADWSSIRLDDVSLDREGAFVDGPFGSNLKADEMTEEGYARVVQLQNIRVSEFIDSNHKYISENKFEELARHGAKPGDLAIAKMAEPVARACLLPEIENQYLVVADCIKLSVDESKHNSRFVMFALNSRPVWKQAFARSRGSTRKRINLTQLKQVQIPSPSLPEQRKIATVLCTIDRAIEKTSELIEQLGRVKQGVRQNILTSGINEDSEVRASPESEPEQYTDARQWTVPNSWELKELSDICSIQVGYAFKSDWYQEEEEEEGNIRVLRGANVGYGEPDWSETYFLEPKRVSEYEEYLLNEGDLIIGMDRPYTNSGFKISRLSETDVPSLLVQRVGRFVPEGCDPDYLHVVLSDWRYQKQVLRRAQGMDIPHISQTDILSPKIPLPPLDEQKRIADRYSSILERIGCGENLLREYKTLKQGLMQDLLPGTVRTTDTNIEVPEEVAQYG